MHCDTMQERVSLLMDEELQEPEQSALFQHLEECAECRAFLGSMMRFRRTSAKDRDALLEEADEVLPPANALGQSGAALLPGAPPPQVFRANAVASRARSHARWPAHLGANRRVPVPVAIGLAMLLLVAGILVGSRLSGRSTQGAPEPGSTEVGVQSAPRTIILCGLPAVDVLGNDPARTNRRLQGGQRQ